LQNACMELKTSANAIESENTKARTRLMAMERELQKRDRLLRQLMMLNKAGHGIGMDLVEKLREERNMLPIYKRRAQTLQTQIQEKDAEIKNLKRDPTFTRVIELQVEYASWTHETKRIEGLLLEPSVELNDAARREVEVHERRAENLEADLDKAEERRKELEAELVDVEADHASWLQQYKDKEKELKNQQDDTRDMAINFKQMLEERKQVEKLQNEIESMSLTKKKYEEEIKAVRSENSAATPASTRSAATTSLGRRAISKEAMHSAPPAPITPAVASSLYAVRAAAALRSGSESLPAQLAARTLMQMVS